MSIFVLFETVFLEERQRNHVVLGQVGEANSEGSMSLICV